MARNTLLDSKSQPARVPPMRAIIEIVDGRLIILPVADSDIDRETILEALQRQS